MKPLVQTANETLAVIASGEYRAPSGRMVPLAASIAHAQRGTQLYRPDELEALVAGLRERGAAAPRVEVTTETTAAAGRRLAQEGVADAVALNFASAKNPGGGFLGGARAQEEDLARCSALHPCLCAQEEYYRSNRASPSLLYTDHLIYSPGVPFFRDDALHFLEHPFLLSIITAPAPNAGAALARDPRLGDEIRATLERRARMVLAVAAARQHRCLVLGAWGCGVFRNDADEVAQVFARALADERLAGHFERVVFAVYDPGGRNLGAFERRFGTARLL